MAETNSIAIPPRVKDLTGQRFGRLLVLGYAGMRQYAGKTNYRLPRWRCLCDCGTTIKAVGHDLKRGHTTSCGCFHRDDLVLRNTTHGKSRSTEHNIWCRILRETAVCERWRDSFENFFADMGPRPSSKHLLRRYPDQNREFSPSNCQWITENLTGKRFGRLVVLRYAGVNTSGEAIWDCCCDCGRSHTVRGYSLRRGDTRSCGCLAREEASKRATIHGKSSSAEYQIWASMKSRCCNANDPDYEYYGFRGIAVCKRWMDSFGAFFEDIGPRPSPKHSIDRYPDNDGNYESGNCRWATASEQQRNKRNSLAFTFMGESKPLVVWAEQYGIKYQVLHYRISSGWNIHRALTTPVHQRRRPHGVTSSTTDS